ncbi:MAG: iron dependent repressor, metal binding and dimerization domain protein [Eubacteriales bacterium]|nr:iron dependent repressor, metal binding and dimerization domain protein [Eubacteriales bacterium]
MGLIGTNIPPSREEKEEDLLERLYRAWREDRQLLAVDFVMEMNVSRKEFNALVKKLVHYGYLEEPSIRDELELTDLGKAQGMECLMRHEKLTQFFQMIGGMDQKEAQEDACRVEHVISQKGLDGIDHFLRYGDVCDRTYTASDLSAVYDEGSYEMLSGVYELDRREPRFLAPENSRLEAVVTLEVRRGASRFLLRPRAGEPCGAVWYKRAGRWTQAEREKGRYVLPTDIFTYTVSAVTPVMEAESVIAFTENGTEPLLSECREINIHVW